MNRTQNPTAEVTDARRIDETAELMKLAGNSTRLKLLYLLETLTEVSVPPSRGAGCSRTGPAATARLHRGPGALEDLLHSSIDPLETSAHSLS
jgi:hypothetical protein